MAIFTLFDGTSQLVTNNQSIAVIDIGSNSVRLVVYRQDNNVWQRLINEKCQCRLGEGVATSGLIQPERMQEAIEALQRFKVLLDHAKPDQMTAIATSAVREADNGPEFVRDSSKIMGIEPKVLSGEAEAEYAARGVQWAVPNAVGVVADLGGSSLELTTIGPKGVGTSISLPIGPLHLVDLFGKDRKSAKAHIDGHIRPAIKRVMQATDPTQANTLYAVGGAWRALASLHIRSSHHPVAIVHRYQPELIKLLDFVRPISFMKRDQAMTLEVSQADRRLTLPFAALIMRRLAKWLAVEAVEFCSAGIREGALALHSKSEQESENELDGNDGSHGNDDKRSDPADSYINAVKSLVPDGGRYGPIGAAMEQWIDPVYRQDLGGIQIIPRQRVQEACELADFGWNEHPSHKKNQTYSAILNSAVLPHDHRERAQLAAIQYYRHKGRSADLTALQMAPMLDPAEQQAAKVLGRLIHLAMQLCRAQSSLLMETDIQLHGDYIKIAHPNHWPPLQATSIKSGCMMLSDACGLSVRVGPRT